MICDDFYSTSCIISIPELLQINSGHVLYYDLKIPPKILGFTLLFENLRQVCVWAIILR